jgi:hypothetical protein
VTVLPEILAIEVLSIVYCELSGRTKSADNLLPKEFSDGDRSDSCERSHLIPLGEVFNRDHSELEIALGRWQRTKDVHSPALQRPTRSDELRWSPRPSLVLGSELTSFASLDNLLGIFYLHWPIETLSERLSS